MNLIIKTLNLEGVFNNKLIVFHEWNRNDLNNNSVTSNSYNIKLTMVISYSLTVCETIDHFGELLPVHLQ